MATLSKLRNKHRLRYKVYYPNGPRERSRLYRTGGKSRKRKPEGYILPRFAPWTISRAIREHLRDCGINARLHDARHTYTTMLQDLGIAPHRAMKRTGHTDMRMLLHYSHGDFKEVYEDRLGFLKTDEHDS